MYSRLSVICKLLLTVSVFTFGLQAQSSGARTELNRGQRWAIVIGISEYKFLPPQQQLKYAARDAESFAAFLRTPQGGAFDEQHLRVLLNEQATGRSIRSALGTWLPANVGESDTVIIYFAGHGAVEEGQGGAYLAPYETEPQDLYASAIQLEALAALLQQRIKARQVLLLADASHSDSLSAGTAGRAQRNPIHQLIGRLATERVGLITMTANRPGEPSRSSATLGGGHGIFTHYLIEALNGAADADTDLAVRADEAFQYVAAAVNRESEGTQRPQQTGRFSNRLVLAQLQRQTAPVEVAAASPAPRPSTPPEPVTAAPTPKTPAPTAAPSVRAAAPKPARRRPAKPGAPTTARKPSVPAATAATTPALLQQQPAQAPTPAGTAPAVAAATPAPADVAIAAPAAPSAPAAAAPAPVSAPTSPAPVATAPVPATTTAAATAPVTTTTPVPPAPAAPTPAAKPAAPPRLPRVNAARVDAVSVPRPATPRVETAAPTLAAPAPPVVAGFNIALETGALLEPRGKSAWDFYLEMVSGDSTRPDLIPFKSKLAEALVLEGDRIIARQQVNEGTALSLSDYQRASNLFAKAYQLRPDDQRLNARQRVSEAQSLMLLQRYEEAQKLLQRALELDPALALGHQALGIAFREQQRFFLAERHLKRAIELAPEWYLPHYELALTYEVGKSEDDAIREYQAALAVNEKLPTVYARLGLLYLSQKKYAEAVTVLEKALALKPDSELYQKLGNAYFSLGRQAEASQAYRQARETRIKEGK